MLSALIAIIYLAFISLGLPDGLLGSAWPLVVEEFDVPISYAGIVSMIISCGTIVSSLFSDKLTRRLGAALVTAFSVALTAAALFGFSIAGSFPVMCLLAVPYGLDAGAVDAALNNYVALHYASRYMNWLHCFWGVGAAVGPYIMGWAIGADLGWRTGYSTVSLIQIILTVFLFLTLPLWKRPSSDVASEDYEAPLGLRDALRIKGVKEMLVAFFGYCGFEVTAALWAASYLVEHRGVDAETAAAFAALFYVGMTGGRLVCGFISDRIGDRNMIRIGSTVTLAGLVMILLPLDSPVLSLAGLVVIGVGAAPVYPSIIHSTPRNFGRENSHAIVGIQMASAYTGSTLLPPLFGLVAQYIHIGLYPLYMALLIVLSFVMSERVNKLCG